MDYMEDYLSGRRIFWCPSGQGNLAYCPQPTDPDDYVYCCSYYYLGGKDMPKCCRWPWHAGAIIALFASAIVLAALLIFFTCWCCPWCPLARRLMRRHEERTISAEAVAEEPEPRKWSRGRRRNTISRPSPLMYGSLILQETKEEGREERPRAHELAPPLAFTYIE